MDTNYQETATMLLSVVAAVAFTGISKSELYRRLQSGELKGKLVGSKVRIKRSDLVDLIDKLPNYGG